MGFCLFLPLVRLLVQAACHNARRRLVFSVVGLQDFTADRLEIYLAQFHPRIHTDGANRGQLQRPPPRKTDVAESGGHMDEQAQPPNRRPSHDHRHKPVGFSVFHRRCQIQLAGLQHHALRRNVDDVGPVVIPGVQHGLSIHHKVLVQSQIVTVRPKTGLVEVLDFDFSHRNPLSNFVGA